MTFPSITKSPWFVGRIRPPKSIKGARHYNPALAKISNGDRVIAWRVEDATGESKIAIGFLAKGLNIQKAEMLDLTPPGVWAEDPRLVVVGDDLWLQYAHVTSHEVGWSVKQVFRKIWRWGNGWQVGVAFIPDVGGNGTGCVKNWVPFDLDETLSWLLWPAKGGASQRQDGQLPKLIETYPVRYPFGETLSGRTQALRLDAEPIGEYLCLVGGATHHDTRCKRYFFAAMTFCSETLNPTGISRRPLAWASDEDETIPCPRDPQYNPSVIYPSGLILEGDSILVSCGVHDSWMCLLRIPLAELDLVDPDDLGDTRAVLQDGQRIHAGEVRVRVTARHPISEPGGPYLPGETFATTPERAAALAHLVEVIDS
jgi:hypothetical protein